MAFLEGDAEELPFPDGSFEVVLSVCDATSTPGHGGTAGEPENDTLALRLDHLEAVVRKPDWL